MSVENRSRGVWDGKPSKKLRALLATLALSAGGQMHAQMSFASQGSSESAQGVTLQELPRTVFIAGVSSDGVTEPTTPVEAQGVPPVVEHVPQPDPEPDTKPEPTHEEPRILGEGIWAKVTGYYCEDVGGYWGDGGGWCGQMANGEVVHEGAAACGYGWEMGQELHIEEPPLNVTCKDRGHLEDYQVDVFSETNANVILAHQSMIYPID